MKELYESMYGASQFLGEQSEQNTAMAVAISVRA